MSTFDLSVRGSLVDGVMGQQRPTAEANRVKSWAMIVEQEKKAGSL